MVIALLAAAAAIVYPGERPLQQVLDTAPAHSIVMCDPNRQVTWSKPVKVNKPLTLWGLNAKLPDKLGNTPLVIIASKGVTFTNFKLTGNKGTVPSKDRAPLVVVAAGEFVIEHGELINGSKDGLMISGDDAGGDIVGGVVRDMVGRAVDRDVVSIGGTTEDKGYKIRNVLVDNVRGYGPSVRGPVEVSDGTDNITVRKVYAEDSRYAVDVQDHKKPTQINRNVVIEDVYALRCRHAIRTDNRPLGHAYLTVRDITAKQCEQPIQIFNTDNVVLQNVRVIDHENGPAPPVYLKNCNGLTLRDVMVENTAFKGPAVLLEDVNEALIDSFTQRGNNPNLTTAILYSIAAEKLFNALRISNVVSPLGITLQSKGKASLKDYLVTNNLAPVHDNIKGK